MFDKLLVKLLSKPKENSFQEKFTYSKNSKELFVFFPNWGGNMKQNSILRETIIKKGLSFLEYVFPRSILSSNAKLTRKEFEKIANQSKKEINNLARKYKFRKITLIGLSLGCVNACMVSKLISLNKLILIVPGNCLAESLWNGLRTQDLRKSFENQGISLEKLRTEWKNLAPENNIRDFKGKIDIFLSKSDKIIPYAQGIKLVAAIKKKKRTFNLKENAYLGHYLTSLDFYRNPQKYLFD